jgi:hypothetical protein
VSSNTVRWGGLAAMLGGAMSVVSAVVIASMPRGCIADECAFRPMRDTAAAGALLMLALLLIMVGAAGLEIRARNAGRFGRLGKTGAVVGAVGVALPVIGSLIQGVLYDGDYPLMPYFVIPGVLALVVGFVLLGLAVLRAGVLPRWATALLISRYAGDARVQRPERAGVDGHTVRYRVGGGGVRALVGWERDGSAVCARKVIRSLGIATARRRTPARR